MRVSGQCGRGKKEHACSTRMQLPKPAWSPPYKPFVGRYKPPYKLFYKLFEFPYKPYKLF